MLVGCVSLFESLISGTQAAAQAWNIEGIISTEATCP
jgi:hypothetical protein